MKLPFAHVRTRSHTLEKEFVTNLTNKRFNLINGMSKIKLSNVLKVLRYINEVMMFLFPFLQKIDEEKKDKDNNNVQPS